MVDPNGVRALGVRALMELLATAPAAGIFEGLFYPSQVRGIAETAGLVVEKTPTLEDLARELLSLDPPMGFAGSMA